MTCPLCNGAVDPATGKCWACGHEADASAELPSRAGTSDDDRIWAGSPGWDGRVEEATAQPATPHPRQAAGGPAVPAVLALGPAVAAAPVTEEPVKTSKTGNRGVILTVLALLAAVIFKGKWVLLLLLGKAKLLLGLFKLKSLVVLLKSGGSMLLMVWVYAMMWPWQFALGAVVLLLVHELGHAVVLRYLGVRFSAPIFIPFLGALIAMKEMPRDVGKEALIAYGGPFIGTIGAQLCFYLYYQTGQPVLLGLAQFGFMINLFNLLPFSPLDGGRIVGAISPKLWLLSLPLLAGVGLYLHSYILLIVVAVGLPRAISAWRKRSEDQDYFQVSTGTRLTAAAAYLGLAAFLAYMMYEAGRAYAVAVPGTGG